jgi:peptidoglycan/LPS O-acetylase OafA/YrhL
MHLSYRREIDGLRAIAVAAVVAYHAGLGGAGYVGVDIFFVISGYLITALLLRELATSGRVDLWQFYARRVRRIFPAAVVVITVVLCLAYLLLPVDETRQVARSAAAAAMFVANLYFQVQTGGYWGADATQMPLLHLWSLSVEEQFYLAWPALLVLVPRARLGTVLAMLALVSFLLAEWMLQSRPEAAFYQVSARAWELAAGALVATLPSRRLPHAFGWVALAALLGACVVRFEHFPGAGAMPAVAASAMLLAVIHGGGTNWLLASRPFVALGLVSYSFYLWHWPLLAIDRLSRVGPSPLSVRLELVGVALLLAIVSYFCVERPVRKFRAPSRRTVGVGFTVMVALGCGAWTWQH